MKRSFNNVTTIMEDEIEPCKKVGKYIHPEPEIVVVTPLWQKIAEDLKRNLPSKLHYNQQYEEPPLSPYNMA